MYRTYPYLVLGFHGCKLSTAKELINNPKNHFEPSNNNYDWLGTGMYFWEGNQERALEYAKEAIKRKMSSGKPAVVGAILDLGRCLNLTEKYHLDEVKASYNLLRQSFDTMQQRMPQNLGGDDLYLRHLDCAVINLHYSESEKKDIRYDSVRAIFQEDKPLYPNAGFTSKAHIQIAIRNPNCIKGYFWPRVLDSQYPKV